MERALGMDNMQPGTLLFDVGGVLVDWDGIKPLQALSGGRLSSEAARRFWLESSWVVEFESGRCPADRFAAGVVEELVLPVSPGQFLEHFISWDRGLFPGAIDLLKKLKPGFVLACLSNNNALHWGALQRETGLQRLFHHCFISCEIGLMKPDLRAFEYVLDSLKTPAREIAFFDDNPECIAAARRTGMDAHLVRGVEQVKTALARINISL